MSNTVSTITAHPSFTLAMSPDTSSEVVDIGVDLPDTSSTPAPASAPPQSPTSPPLTPQSPRYIYGDEPRRRKCPQCPVTQKPFKTISDMKQHLASGYHDIISEKSNNVGGGGGETIVAPPQPQQTGMIFPKPTSDTDKLALIQEMVDDIRTVLAETPRVTFSAEMLQEIDTNLQETQILILSTTRDLALYIDSILAARLESMHITCYACVGGTVIREDIKNLSSGPHIVSGTLGRVMDMMQRKCLRTENIRTVVFNREEDLLRKQFHEQLFGVYRFLKEGTMVVRAAVKVPEVEWWEEEEEEEEEEEGEEGEEEREEMESLI